MVTTTTIDIPQRGIRLDPATCAPLLKPMPRRELRCAAIIGASDEKSVAGLAVEMGLTLHTTRMYLKSIAEKIPGTLPPVARIRVWARGAPLSVLTSEAP